jgi:hypothetical protein
MSTKAKRKPHAPKESGTHPHGSMSPASVKSAAKKEKKKGPKEISNRLGQKKTHTIKAIFLMGIALFFFAYMVYSGGSTGGYLSLVIGLVCGLLGVLYLREGKKGG